MIVNKGFIKSILIGNSSDDDNETNKKFLDAGADLVKLKPITYKDL